MLKPDKSKESRCNINIVYIAAIQSGISPFITEKTQVDLGTRYTEHIAMVMIRIW